MALTPETAVATGMTLAYHAQEAPERTALKSERGDRTFSELNARSNQLVRTLRRAGLKQGDAVALLCSNRPEFVETLSACQRAGFRITPINWHLSDEEVHYIVDNCEAKALIAEDRFAQNSAAAANLPSLLCKLAPGGLPGFDDFNAAIAGEEDSNIDDPSLGTSMLYTSGTTGRPKGVYRKNQPPASPLVLKLQETAAFDPTADFALNTGPLYHAAPLALNLNFPLAAGVGVYLMDRWDAEQTLKLISDHKCTHTHVVPTMLHRMLQLPETVRTKYDLSSMRWVLHGAAPCPPKTKADSIEWLGPILFEYYAATEGGGIFVDSHDWQKKPGSVGRPLPGVTMKIANDNDDEVAQGDVGTIYFQAPQQGRFEYFKAPEKTDGAYRGDYFTMGDMGYLDEDGFLFLTGRSAETIISGGVNIYPAEIDAIILQHPAVHDVATVGVPNEEWGEEIKAVVQLNDGAQPSEETAADILAFAESHLPSFKRPRSVDFATDLPRLPTGKIVRRQVREKYWEGHDKKI